MDCYGLLLFRGSLVLSPLSFVFPIFLVIPFLLGLSLSSFGTLLVTMIVKLMS